MDYFRQRRVRGKRKKEDQNWPKKDLHNYKKISKQLMALKVQRAKSRTDIDEQVASHIYLS